MRRLLPDSRLSPTLQKTPRRCPRGRKGSVIVGLRQDGWVCKFSPNSLYTHFTSHSATRDELSCAREASHADCSPLNIFFWFIILPVQSMLSYRLLALPFRINPIFLRCTVWTYSFLLTADQFCVVPLPDECQIPKFTHTHVPRTRHQMRGEECI